MRRDAFVGRGGRRSRVGVGLVVVVCCGVFAGRALATASPPTIYSSFGSSSTPQYRAVSLSFTIVNPNRGIGLTGIGFTDSLPAGLVVATPSGVSGDCGGSVTATATAKSVSLSGGALAPSDACTISVNVIGDTAGQKDNSVTVSSSAGTGNTGTASLLVVAAPTASTAFAKVGSGAIVPWIPLKGKAPVSFTLANPNTATQLSGIGFTDSLPLGLVVATPNGLAGTCGRGTIRAAPGSRMISLSGATLTAGPSDPASSCSFSVNVTGTTNGVKSNSVGMVSSNEGGSRGVFPASLSVVAPGPRVYFSNDPDTVSFLRLDGSVGSYLQTGSATATPTRAFEGVAIDAAAGRVYWANHEQSGQPPSAISFARLDGTGGADFPSQALDGQPVGVAVDPPAHTIYWANYFGNTISVANLGNGSGGTLNTGSAPLDDPTGVALDPAGGRIYWANYSFSGTSSIAYAGLDGSGASAGTLNTTGATVKQPYGLAIDPVGRRIYWSNLDPFPGSISYANLDGSGGGDLTITGTSVSEPLGLAIDPIAQKVYWSNTAGGYGYGAIDYANLDGSGARQLPYPGVNPPGQQWPKPKFLALLDPPAAAGAPAISGGSTTGSLLSCSKGAWAPDLLGSFLYRVPQRFAYQWSLNGTNVAEASKGTYMASASGVYRCQVTASNAAGSASQRSAPHTVG